METNNYIPIAVHSPAYAGIIMQKLAAHGIKTKSENVTVGDRDIFIGVRISVPEKDAVQTIKIAESGSSPADVSMAKIAGTGGVLLIPVDFSDYSIPAGKAGFEFAVRLDMHPLIMHTFTAPVAQTQMAFPDSFPDSFSDEFQDAAVGMEIRTQTEKRMEVFEDNIKKLQNEGELSDIRFSTQVSQGLPEEVISEYCRVSPPGLIVMATRGKRRREADMIGSVTAEVLDTCRVPVFTVPENISFIGVENITRLIFFCNMDQKDIYSIDSLMSMFDCPKVDVTLIPVSDAPDESVKRKVNELQAFLSSKYPIAEFDAVTLTKKNFRQDLETTVESRGIQLLIVPNKKTNIFSRLFKPGIAHRILFERDMPMLALPV